MKIYSPTKKIVFLNGINFLILLVILGIGLLPFINENQTYLTILVIIASINMITFMMIFRTLRLSNINYHDKVIEYGYVTKPNFINLLFNSYQRNKIEINKISEISYDEEKKSLIIKTKKMNHFINLNGFSEKNINEIVSNLSKKRNN